MVPIRITVTAMLLVALAGCGGDGETPVSPDARLPDLAVDSLTVARLEPTDAEPVTISFRIRNVGAATTEPTPFIVKIDGTAFGTHRTIPLAAGGVVRMSTTMPPLAAGTRRIEVIIDPDNRIEERDEQNNQASVTLSVAGRLSLGQPMAVSSATTDEVILFRVDIDEDARAALNVELAGGSGDADLFVHFGERPPHHYDYECVSGNPASDELCQMVPVRAGPLPRCRSRVHPLRPLDAHRHRRRKAGGDLRHRGGVPRPWNAVAGRHHPGGRQAMGIGDRAGGSGHRPRRLGKPAGKRVLPGAARRQRKDRRPAGLGRDRLDRRRRGRCGQGRALYHPREPVPRQRQHLPGDHPGWTSGWTKPMSGAWRRMER